MELDGIAIDAFGTLFDLGSLRERFKSVVVPWTWHATASGRVRPLPEIVEAAGLDPAALRSLPAFSDAAGGLDALRSRWPLAVLSNGDPAPLVAAAGISDRFEHLLAAEQVSRYKPAPEVYGLAVSAFGSTPERVLMVSSNEWDVAGAAQAGLRTAWLQRDAEPAWVLGVEADVVAEDLRALAARL